MAQQKKFQMYLENKKCDQAFKYLLRDVENQFNRLIECWSYTADSTIQNAVVGKP